MLYLGYIQNRNIDETYNLLNRHVLIYDLIIFMLVAFMTF